MSLWQMIVVSAVFAVAAALGAGVVCDSMGWGHTSYTRVRAGCVVEITKNFSGHVLAEESVCPH